MIWNIIRRRPLTSFGVVFLLSLFFSCVGLSQESFATSVTCSATDLLQSTNTPFLSSSYCQSYPFDGSKPIFVYDFSFTSDNPTSFFFYSGTGAYYSNIYNNISSFSESSIIFTSGYYQGFYSVYGFRTGRNVTFSTSFKLSDDLSDIVSTPECPVCPVIPDNPYDTKFDNITKAIYVCGAILIMLYFFFCIYKIIVKDGGSR